MSDLVGQNNSGAVPVITIDGPSGSGKGTIARRVAAALGWHLLDSGALYRLVGLAAFKSGVLLSDQDRCAQIAAGLEVRFGANAEGHEQIWLSGQEVSAEIRTEAGGERASQVAVIPAVRAALFDRQRRFAEWPGLVADGRDMGTVIFPTAPLKIYLVASAEERARRRYKQLNPLLKVTDDGGSLAALFGPAGSATIEQVAKEIAERDQRDANRAIAPLKPASDAVTIDSTSMSIEAVVEKVLELQRERFAKR